MCCSVVLNFAYLTSFYFFYVARHLWSNLQTCKLFLGEKDFECTKCKANFKFFFNIFGFFMPFWWEWQLALYILSNFPGFKNLNGLNDLTSLNNISGLNDLNSLISSKNLYCEEKWIFLMVCYFLLLEKGS